MDVGAAAAPAIHPYLDEPHPMAEETAASA